MYISDINKQFILFCKRFLNDTAVNTNPRLVKDFFNENDEIAFLMLGLQEIWFKTRCSQY